MNLKPYPELGFIALTGSLRVFGIVCLLWDGQVKCTHHLIFCVPHSALSSGRVGSTVSLPGLL